MVQFVGPCYYWSMTKRVVFLILFTISSICFGGICDDAVALANLHDGSIVMTVQGNSMIPMFRNNDVVVVHPMKKEGLKKGMICIYKNELGELISHSVVSIDPLKFKGMNNKISDKDNCVEIVGIVYGIFNNWLGEKVEKNRVVLAKKN
jgi:signal peptidase I